MPMHVGLAGPAPPAFIRPVPLAGVSSGPTRRPGLPPRRLRSRHAPRRASEQDKGTQDFDFADFVSKGFAFVSGVFSTMYAFLTGFDADTKGESQPKSGSARIVQQLGSTPVDAQGDQPLYSLGPFPKCTEASNLRMEGRHFTILTTAALPWRTGPAVNPLMRALTLAKRGFSVKLVLPWIKKENQKVLFDIGQEVFDDPLTQEKFIREWCIKRAGIDPAKLQLEISWYKAVYVEAVRSIFPEGDISQELGDGERDVLIMEEPEHLCWYHNGARWPDLFKHVVGVVHTNYRVFVQGMGYEGVMGTPILRDSLFYSFTTLVCAAYSDVTIKLSPAGLLLPNEVICNLNGVREEFLEQGRRTNKMSKKEKDSVYIIGKAVFQKGWGEMLDTMDKAQAKVFEGITIDGFGSGPDYAAICKRVANLREKGFSIQVSPGLDHVDESFRKFNVLVNPSTSEILSTVVAEAIAMRKRVVLPTSPCNVFFQENFPDRCHFYNSLDVTSFVKALRAALDGGMPEPLTESEQTLLSWDAAIDRLNDAAEVHVLSGPCERPSEVDSAKLAYQVHRRVQNDVPSLSNLLKSATLKEAPSWEENLKWWRSGKLVVGEKIEYVN